MISRSTFLHLRLPFSYFLLPIFLFALSISPNFTGPTLLWTFFITHFLLYPASNAYNSYFDRDEGSIGVLENPPPVEKGLYLAALLLDLVAILLALLFVNIQFAGFLLVYGLVSKAYSHPAIRLKKYAIVSWIVTGVFQGWFSFMMCYIGINNFGIEAAWRVEVLVGGLLTSGMLWANYPMTQIYQHEEDRSRGDITLSIKLGIRGTFYFAMAAFLIVSVGFFAYFVEYFEPEHGILFLIALTPVIAFFLFWLRQTFSNEGAANYKNAMWLNLISATSLNAFFIYFFLSRTNILQVLRI